MLQRHQPQIARDLLPPLRPVRSADHQHEGQRRQGTYSGMCLQTLRLGTFLHFLLDGLRQFGNRWGSVGPATPADRAVAGSPTELTRTTPVARAQRLATAVSCSAVPSLSATVAPEDKKTVMHNGWIWQKNCACVSGQRL